MSDFNLPIDFTDRMKELLTDEWEEFLDCYENERYQALRVNALKYVPEYDEAESVEAFDREVLQAVGMEDIEPVPWAEHGYYYSAKLRPGRKAYHEMGLYYIQEPSAMSAAGLLDAKPGEYVLDLCSAPGGKATQLAAAMHGEGLLVANEIHPARCRILSQNIERMGVTNALVTNEDPHGLAPHFPLFFDKILVDAPCSGEGMFRKNPDAMAEWSLEQVQVCADRQADILEQAAIMLKQGGRLVYSTCTFAPQEDEMAIAAFLRAHPEFEVEKVSAPYFEKAHPEWAAAGEHDGADTGIAGLHLEDTFRLWPHKLHGEGHYVAVLHKKGTCERAEYKKKQPGRKNVQKKAEQASFEEFCRQVLTEDMCEWLRASSLTLFGDNLYRLPEGISSLAGLKVERPGLQLGTFKKDRFEPSHALALSLNVMQVKYYVNLKRQDPRAAGYFRGEGFFLQDQDVCSAVGRDVSDGTKLKGFCPVFIDGFCAGWGKLAGGQLKNHYPKGLRKEVEG